MGSDSFDSRNERGDSAKVPSSPKLLKLWLQATRLTRDVEPEDYLGAIAELLFLTIVGSYCITFLNDKIQGKDVLANNPIRNMVGYNNPCAFWDQPPALYFASFMFCPMIFLGLRYAITDSTRARMQRGVNTRQGMCACINCMYGLSQIVLMGIFVIRPKMAPALPLVATPEEIEVMNWNMRAHSACFLQYVPVLCITMSANYFEGYLSGNPRAQPTAVGWAILSFYITSTTLETIFATYAIFFYKGSYQQTTGYESNFQVDSTFMMLIDYCWFISLPLAASFQPEAPNLVYSIRLEKSWEEFEDHDPNDDIHTEWADEEEVADSSLSHIVMRVVATLMILWTGVIPFLVLVLWAAGSSQDPYLLLGIAVFVPLLLTCILWMPIRCESEPSENYAGGLTGFTLRGAKFSFSNYTCKLLSFARAAAKTDFRPAYGQWFTDQCDDDEDIGVDFGDNTEMIYGWQACKEKLETLGARIEAGRVERESELALTVMNNLMWPEAKRFALGFDNEQHAFVRPYLASVFDCGRDYTWTERTLREEFRAHFNKLHVLDHDLVTRNLTDITNPANSKTVVTQMCLKVLHKVAFDVSITDAEAIELAALQTTQLLPAVCPAMVARSFWMWSIVGGPARDHCKKWIKRYKGLIKTKWPDLATGDDYWVDLLASAFLDAMTQAGGRSVPLAIDLTLGYILSKNRPDCLNNVDFQNPENIKQLLMECMRFHPPVTVIPTWVPDEERQGEWKHELICLDRACADPDVFPDPDEFKLDRDPACSMAWGDFAYVGGRKDHPHSHGCPGKQLSIDMVIAFILEYQAAGTWELHTDDIKFNYYGTKGFKCTKHPSAPVYRRRGPQMGH